MCSCAYKAKCMKIILSIFCLGVSFFSFGQLKESVKALSTVFISNPVVYFDSIPTRMELFYFDTIKIKSMVTVQGKFDSSTNSSGKIYITSKNPKDYNFLSFTDLKSKYIGSNKKPVLLLLNGNFIKNPTQINIDSSYIHKVEVESGADFEELKNIYPLLSIVNIQTKNRASSNEDRNINLHSPERQIFLNGLPNKSLPE